MTGLKLGKHLSDIIIQKHEIQSPKLNNVVQMPSKLTEFTITDFICFGFGIFSIVLVIVLASTIRANKQILFATVFAPIGID